MTKRKLKRKCWKNNRLENKEFVNGLRNNEFYLTKSDFYIQENKLSQFRKKLSKAIKAVGKNFRLIDKPTANFGIYVFLTSVLIFTMFACGISSAKLSALELEAAKSDAEEKLSADITEDLSILLTPALTQSTVSYKSENDDFEMSSSFSDSSTAPYTSVTTAEIASSIFTISSSAETTTSVFETTTEETTTFIQTTPIPTESPQTEPVQTDPPQTEPVTVETAAPPPISGNYGQRYQYQWEIDYANQLFDLVNEVRVQNGINPLKKLDVLTAAATDRAWEITINRSHTRPDGSSCFTVLNEYGLYGHKKSENICYWWNSPQAALNTFLDDYAHSSPIFNSKFEYLGVGFYYIENDPNGCHYYWTQLFYGE